MMVEAGKLPECPNCAEKGEKVKMRAVMQGPPEGVTTTAYECPNCGYVEKSKP